MIRFFDSHAHLSSKEILPSIEGVMARAKEAHVFKILNICTDLETLREGFVLQDRFPEIHQAGATTPHDVEREGEELFPLFAQAAREKKLVAVGETGLDYHYQELDRDVQKRFLKRYLALAAECQLPVIFHCREAFADLFAIADDEYPKGAPAILHCFTGTVEEAEEVFSRGWYLSLSGIVTFKNSGALKEVAQKAPLDRLLIETDAPYLAPLSRRGKQNEPSFLGETARCIATLKGMSVEEIGAATFANAERVLRLAL